MTLIEEVFPNSFDLLEHFQDDQLNSLGPLVAPTPVTC